MTTTEFRQSQKKFLDMAAEGVSIIICRGKEMFMLNRVSPTNLLDDETIRRIEQARLQFSRSETTPIASENELQTFLNAL